MKSISLSIKLQIPAIYHKHPFSEIPITEEYFDASKTGSHTKHLESYKLIPFLNSVQNLSNRFGDRFKLGISISGISIKLLQKHSPTVISGLKNLSDNGVIEFFAEPWSNSILPYFNEQELVRQTERHKQAIQTTFAQSPSVFMADSALNPENFGEFKPFPGCKTVFTCSNQLLKKQIRPDAGTSYRGCKTQFLINHTLSRKFQHNVSDISHGNSLDVVAPIMRFLRKHGSLVKPLNLLFNPLAMNISSYDKWESAITWFLNNTENSFYSLSDLEEVASYFAIINDYSEAMLTQFKLPDNWMKNNMQHEAFKQFRNIYKLQKTGTYPYIPEAWDYLQDMNSFFFMSDSFFLEEFADQHFNPYRSPHEAFTSYMNAASNFWNVRKNNLSTYFKTNFLFAPTIN